MLLEFFLLVSASKDWLAYTLNLVIGWALMWATGTLFEQAGLTEEETEPLESKPPTSPHVVAGEEPAVAPAPPKKSCLPPRLHVYVRASLAITGCMMFWLGASMLLEIWSNVYYVSPTDDSARPPDESTNGVLHCNDCTDSTPARNGIFILLGLFMFVITDTMAIHAGVEESIQSIAPEMTAAQQQHDAAASSSSLPVDQHRLVSVVGSDSHLASAPPRSTFARFLANPLVRHIRALTSLMGVMMLWEGVWDAAFNAEAESHGWERMVVYTSVGLIGLMLTNSLFANSGVVPPFAMAKRSTQIQQRLGFHLQEKHFLSAAHGGQAHDPDMLSALEPQRSADDAAPADAPSFNTLRHPSPQAPTTVGSNAAMSSSPVPTPPLDGAQLDMSSKLPFRSMDA